MKYFTTAEIFRSIIASVFFGATLGCLYCSLSQICHQIKNFVFGFFEALGVKQHKINEKARQIENNQLMRSSTFDFLFVLFSGMIYIVLSYVFLDLVMRVYMILFVLSSFYISHKTIGSTVNRFIKVVCDYANKLLFFILWILLYPIRFILLTFKKLICLLGLKLREKYKIMRSNQLKKRKIRATVIDNKYF